MPPTSDDKLHSTYLRLVTLRISISWREGGSLFVRTPVGMVTSDLLRCCILLSEVSASRGFCFHFIVYIKTLSRLLLLLSSIDSHVIKLELQSRRFEAE